MPAKRASLKRPRPSAPRHARPASRRPGRSRPPHGPPGRNASARIEFELAHEAERTSSIPVIHQLEELLRETEVIESADLLRLSAQLLRGLSEAGFRRLDHWEVRPGGWLPLPGVHHHPEGEHVAHLLVAFRTAGWEALSAAHTFAARLSSEDDRIRLAVVLDRVHRERRPALSVEMTGAFAPARVRELARDLARYLPVVHAEVREYSAPGAVR